MRHWLYVWADVENEIQKGNRAQRVVEWVMLKLTGKWRLDLAQRAREQINKLGAQFTTVISNKIYPYF